MHNERSLAEFYESEGHSRFSRFVHEIFEGTSISKLHVFTSHLSLCIARDVESVVVVPRTILSVTPQVDPETITIELNYCWDREVISRRSVIAIASGVNAVRAYLDEFARFDQNLGKSPRVEFK